MQEDEKQREEQEYQSWMGKHQAMMESAAENYTWKLHGNGDKVEEYTAKVTKEKSHYDEYYKELTEAKIREIFTVNPIVSHPETKKGTKKSPYAKLKKPSSSVEETPSTSLLSDLFSLVWETINNMGLPFEVLTNIEFYKTSIMDADFVTKFVHALNNNLVIVPIKIVNINDLNLRTLSFPGYVIDSAIRAKFGFRMYVTFFISSLDPEQVNQYYDKDHVFLELHSTSPSYKAMKKEILDRFNELQVEMEQVDTTLDKLVKSDPNYHKMVYDRNKSKISIDLLKTKIRDLDNKIYKLEKGVLPDHLLEKNDDKFRGAKSNLFSKILRGTNTNEPIPSIAPGTGGHKFTFTIGTAPWDHNSAGSGTNVTSSLIDTIDNDWVEPPTSIAQNTEQASPYDLINWDNNTYVDFEGFIHDIGELDESMLDNMLDDDLISIDSYESIRQAKGYSL
jgi:hypothetical protein